MYKYEFIIYWDNQDGVYIADVPKLPGCSAHGKTFNTVLDNAKEAIRLRIDTARNLEIQCRRLRDIV
jgi:predicted RNase H-like HicB family nuclease